MKTKNMLLLCSALSISVQTSSQTLEQSKTDMQRRLPEITNTVEILAKKAAVANAAPKTVSALIREHAFETQSVEIGVEYFFEVKAKSCDLELCFGFAPTPIIYFQNRNKNVQLLATTIGQASVIVIRYKF